MKKFLSLHGFIMVLLILVVTNSRAQIQVIVNVVPPYSTQAKDYLQQGNSVMITLINGYATSKNVRVVGTLSGVNNNIVVKLRDDFMPTGPIVLAPGQNKLLTLDQLKVFNSNITSNDILVQGFKKEDYLNGGNLPEGLYKLCMKAFVYNDPAGIVAQSEGCGAFNIQLYDAPMILNPVDKTAVKPLNPQFVNFSWTPSGQVGKTKYTFKIVDLTATNVFNPNDAFNGNVLPYFQQTNININSLQLDNSKPKLKNGNKYAVEVTAYDPQNKTNYKNKGKSQVIVFDYKDGGVNNNPLPNQNDAPAGPCIASTKWNGNLKKDNKDGLPNGTQLAIGNFIIRNTVFSKTNGGYNGTGEILVNFLKSKIKVEFTGIKVNSDNRVHDGKVTAKVTANNIIDEGMSKVKDGNIDDVPNMQQLMNKLESAQRKVANLSPNNPAMDLPLAFPKDEFNVGIVGIIFEPTEAYVNALFNTPLPQLPANEYVILSAKGIAIHPNGYGNAEIKIGLAKDKTVSLAQGKMYITIEDGLSKTYAMLDCSGIKEVKITGKLEIDRSLLLPLNNQYAVINDPKVKVSVPFAFAAQNNFDDFIIEKLTISHPFTLPGISDFVIKPTEVALDLSSVKNLGNFKNNDKTWNGIYFKSLQLQLPDAFKNGNQAAKIEFADMYIGKQGFTGNFAVEKTPIIAGTLAGFGYSLTKLGLNIQNNAISGGLLKGELKLPLGDKADVGFEGTIAKGNNGATISLGIQNLDEIDANFFLAKIKLEKNSEIKFEKDNNDKLTVSTKLNGNIGIDFDKSPANSAVSSFELPTLDFQNLSIKPKEGGGVPEINFAAIGLQSKNKVQAKIGNFELNLNDVDFKKNGNSIGLKLDLGLSLFGGEQKNSNGAGGSTAFTIWAAYNNNGKTFAYSKTTLDKITVDADLGAAKIKGSIEIFNQDETFGNGFRGSVEATLRGLGAKVGVTVQFGKTLANKGNFKYWYFDAMANFGNTGINIPGTAASLYGFGGGAWCNMMPKNVDPPSLLPNQFVPVSKGGDAAPTQSGAEYVPSKGKVGFFAAIMFGMTGSKTAFNGDLKFSMTFNEDLSVNHVKLEGNAFIMQNPNNIAVRQNPDNAMVHCYAKIEYDGPTNCISGNFGATINIKKIIEGGGELSFKFDMPDKDNKGNVINPNEQTKWFIEAGSWTVGVDPFDDDARLHAKIGFDAKVVKAEIKFQAYFMVGNDLPKTLPPMPDYIYQLVKDEGMNEKTKPMPPAVYDQQNLAFAFGAGIKLTAGFDFFVVKADLEAAAGFDVLLANVNGTCNGSPVGFNGWYAQGQAYAYLKGDIKLFRKITLASFVAGAVLQVKLPNPNWIRGDIVAYIDVFGIDAGEYHGTFEKGSLCDNLKTEFDPFKNVKLIKSITPENKAKKVDPYSNFKVSLAYSFGYGGVGSSMNAYDAFNNKQMTWKFQAMMELKDKFGKKVNCQYLFNDENPRLVTIQPKEILLDSADYTLTVWASCKNDVYAGKLKGISEEMSVKFTTAGYPTEIKMSDIGDAYPLPGQRYVMRKDTEGKLTQGRLDIKRDMTYFASKYYKDYKLYIRFRKAGTTVNTDVHYASFDNDPEIKKFENSLIFYLPQTLEKGVMYQMSVVLKPRLANSGLKEKIVFEGYHFKTSKYESLKEKFADMDLKKVGYLSSYEWISNKDYHIAVDYDDMQGNFKIPVLLMEGKEGFDTYEYDGYKNTAQQTKYTGGKLWTGSENTNWLNQQAYSFPDLHTNKISQSQKSHLSSMADLSSETGSYGHDRFYVNYSGYTPFVGNDGYPFASTGTARFLKNSSWFVTELRNNKTLGANDDIGAPEGILSQAEIDEQENAQQGGGFYNQDMQVKGKEGKTYWALADYTSWKAMMDMNAIQDRWLSRSKTYENVNKTWGILKKMGYPLYPAGTKKLNFYMSNFNGQQQSPFFTVSYMYVP